MQLEYRKYMSKAEFDKALHTLMGIIEGIQADARINSMEIEELQNWCLLQSAHQSKYPFKEIVPMVRDSIADGIMTEEEIEDIRWLCTMYLNENPYFDAVTSDIQVLHGILHGILSDGAINAKELEFLSKWLEETRHLESVYPYDEVYSLVFQVLRDGKIEPEEERLLKGFFADFIDLKTSYNLYQGEIDEIKKEMNINGLCALAPDIQVQGRLFCFTGESSRMKRSDIQRIIIENGGRFTNNVTADTDYLVIGDQGNPCWAFSCYGRKVEKAVKLRKQGKKILIVHEVDFWDALA
jgi:NAD-dependent DNA ligase